MTSGIPVTILAGMERSGKSAFLRQLQCQTPDRRTVIVGHGLAGCASDLTRVLRQLMAERESGAAHFERVIVECSGTDSPSRTALALFLEEAVSDYFLLDAIVTVVDALHGARQLATHDVAVEQAAFADRILLSKCDLVSHGQQQALRQRLLELNPRAAIFDMENGRVDTDALFDTGAFNLGTMLALEPRFFSLPDHASHGAVDVLRIGMGRPQPASGIRIKGQLPRH